jgi:hypothetical protein
VPEAAKQREAEAAVRKTFNLDQAKTAKEKADLARTLLQAAAASGAKDAELYVLLRLAKEFAAMGLDVRSALEAIDARAAAFNLDAMAEKVDLFSKMTVKGPGAAGWAAAALEVAQEAAEASRRSRWRPAPKRSRGRRETRSFRTKSKSTDGSSRS